MSYNILVHNGYQGFAYFVLLLTPAIFVPCILALRQSTKMPDEGEL